MIESFNKKKEMDSVKSAHFSYQLLDKENPVFREFILWSSVLVIKVLLMASLTSIHRFKTKVCFLTSEIIFVKKFSSTLLKFVIFSKKIFLSFKFDLNEIISCLFELQFENKFHFICSFKYKNIHRRYMNQI